MSFKDTLLALNSYPEATSSSAIEDAVSIAEVLGAKISAIACKIQIKAPASPLGNFLLDVPAMVAAEMDKSASQAAELLTAFHHVADKKGVLQECISERCLMSQVSEVLVEYSRFRDLTMIAVADGNETERAHAEAIIFGSGHPTIVLPDTRKRAAPFAIDTVIVAWDFSRPAARAVADAMPILERAKRVCVLTVTKEKAIHTRRSGTDLVAYLSRHGVDVVVDAVETEGRSIGEVFEAHAAHRNADLLVMGAYGHSRFREFILGGATKSMLERPPLPLFLSH